MVWKIFCIFKSYGKPSSSNFTDAVPALLGSFQRLGRSKILHATSYEVSVESHRYFCTSKTPPVKNPIFSYSSTQNAPFDEGCRLARAIDLLLETEGVILLSTTKLAGTAI
jgi:hypothetical protein